MLNLEAIKRRMERPGFGHLVMDANDLLEEVERLVVENQQLKSILEQKQIDEIRIAELMIFAGGFFDKQGRE